jgi:DNA-binding NarL/FixJ family response regulator
LHSERYAAVDRATVWILEDRDEYRLTVQELVNSTEDLHCPNTFRTTEELLVYIGDHFAPEVMLVDIGLPGLDGIEAVRRVHGFSPATQLVMLTIHEDNDRVFDALCSGATGYLLKNTPLERILGAIRDVLRGGVPMSPEIARRILNLFRHIRAPRWDYQLTDRERDVLNQLVAGKSKKQIATALVLSRHTIDTHMRNIYAKLHVHSGKSAVAKALQEKLV